MYSMEKQRKTKFFFRVKLMCLHWNHIIFTSNSPSSVESASTKRLNVAAFTKRTRTVSHSKCDISSSESYNNNMDK